MGQLKVDTKTSYDGEFAVCSHCGGAYSLCPHMPPVRSSIITADMGKIHKIRAKYALEQLGPDADPEQRQHFVRRAQDLLDAWIKRGTTIP